MDARGEDYGHDTCDIEPVWLSDSGQARAHCRAECSGGSRRSHGPRPDRQRGQRFGSQRDNQLVRNEFRGPGATVGVIAFRAAKLEILIRVTLLPVVRGGAKKPLARVMVPLMVPFGVAVAENVTGEPARPAAVADVICEPGSRPSFSCTLVAPFASV